jgi:hypothetical protein
MKVLISTWKPWRVIQGATLAERVLQAQKAHAGLCIKGTDGAGLYGPESWGMFRLPQYAGKSNDDLERLAKSQGVSVDLWCYVYLADPTGEANAICQAVARWNPGEVFIDAESDAKKNTRNLGAFLRSLGRLPARVWLQSYRRPDLHRELGWEKWLGYKAEGRYIVDGLAPQAYPIGAKSYVDDFSKMLEQYERLLEKVKRPNAPYFMTLPAFEERGWSPNIHQYGLGTMHLLQELRARLKGLNFWRQQFLFMPEFARLLKVIQDVGEVFDMETNQPDTTDDGDELGELHQVVSAPAGAKIAIYV